MEMITKTQIAAFHAILNEHKLYDDKQNIVEQISNGRTRSVSALTRDEAMHWINAMNKALRQAQGINPMDERQKMLKYIIAMAHEIGMIKKQLRVMKEGGTKEVNNYDDLHAWIKKYGYLKKDLNKYSYAELPKLVTAFENMYRSKLKPPSPKGE
jgi:hypothetical protein